MFFLLFYSDVIIANTNELYTEQVTVHERKNEVQHYKDLVKKDQDSLYDSAADGVALNPVYDRFSFFERKPIHEILHNYIIDYDSFIFSWLWLSVLWSLNLKCT